MRTAKRNAATLLAVSALVGIGASVFSFGPSAANFSGPFGSSGGGAAVRTGEDFVTTGLGEDVSFEKVTVAGTSSTADALTILSGRLRLAPSNVSSAVFYWDTSNGFNLGNQLNLCDGCFVAVDSLSPKRTSETLGLYGAHGVTFVPQSAVDACASGRMGQVTALSSDGRLYQCDGSLNGKLAQILSGSASLDFPSLNPGEKSSALTVTVTGAATTDTGIHCQQAGSMGDHLEVLETWVSSANTVSVRIKNSDAAATEDPAAATYTCTIVR